MKTVRKFLKYLFIPGLILAIAGLVAGLIGQKWLPLYVGLLIAGIILLVVWLGFVFSTAQGFWSRRSTKIGANAIVATLSLLAIVGLLNFLAVRYSTRIDLTENQLFTLAPQSQEIVKNLSQPLKVWVFDRDPHPVDRELLETYRRYSPNLTFEFVDPDVKLSVAKQFNVKTVGEVHLEYGSKKQLVQTLTTFNQREPLSEVNLTNGIEKILRDRTLRVYFLQGHGEHPLTGTEGSLSQAIATLKQKGYEVNPLNLAETPAIPEDANVLIIAGAKRKLLQQEVTLLKDYSDRGGSLFLMVDPDTDLGLDPLFKEWGIQLDRRVIIDGSGTGSILNLGPATPLITRYGDHPITKDFNDGISIYPLARPVGTVKVKGVEAVTLLETSDSMWGESNLTSEELSFDPQADTPGPFDLGVALTRDLAEKATKPLENQTQPQASPSPSPAKPSEKNPQKPSISDTDKPDLAESSDKEKPKTSKSRLAILGNSTFATNGLFDNPSLLNGDIFLNSVQWLASEEEQSLSIRPKEAENRRIVLSTLQAGIIGWVSLVVMPLLALVMAFVVWWRRR